MLASSRTPRRNLRGRYTPTKVNEHSRWRFFRIRRDELLQRIAGTPNNERQLLAVEQLVKSQWALFVAECDVAAAPDTKTRSFALRVANDARKHVLLWHRELTAATPPPTPAPQPTLEQVLGDIVRRRAAQPEDAA